jgi:outer membrane protein OmpA-like peptidoglycan-associated protein
MGMNSQSSADSTYYETFSSAGDWEIIDKDDAKTEINNGYLIEHKVKEGSYCPFKRIPIDARKDFSLELALTITSYSESFGCGLIWGMTNWDNYNSFIVSPSGYHLITQGVDKKTNELVPWAKNSDVKEYGENILKVEKKGDRFNFFVNGQQVYTNTSADIKVTGDWVGIILYAKKQVRVRYLKATGKFKKLNLVPNAIKGYKHENLGENVNTIYNDRTPVIAPDGRTIYYCYESDPAKSDDIHYSKLDANGKWQKAETFGYPINNKEPNAVQSVSADNNVIYLLHRYKADGTYNGPGLSVTMRTADGWTVPKDVVIKNLVNKHKHSFHSFSADAKYMLHAIQTKDSYGDSDIYLSFKNDDGTYSEPMNVGDAVNTYGNETTPFLASDNRTMYFSSNGYEGYGGNDIFVTHRLDDTWKNWSEPQNLGPEINTKSWDAYFTLPASGEEAYMVTDNNTLGKSDIVKVKLTEQARPKPVVLVSGKVLNKKTNEPLSAAIKYFDLQTNEDAGGAISNPSTGEYNIILQAGKKYGFRAEKDKFYAVNDMLDLTNLTEYKEIRKDLFLVPIEVGQSIRLNNVFFDFNKADLKPESFGELDRLVQFLKLNPNMEIELGGHTDNVGAEDYNVKLSQQRTESVLNYLVSKGIDKTKLKAKGYGKSKPVAGNDTEEGKATNRRVEFTILKQ